MPAKIHQFPCLSDNFGVLIHDPATGATAAIDAPEAAAVEKALQDTGWTLTDILVTHHHADHTQGIPELKAKYKCKVTAPKNEVSKFADADATYGGGDTVKAGLADRARDRYARPHRRPYLARIRRRQDRVCRRHAVLDRLRPGDRRHAGADVGLAA